MADLLVIWTNSDGTKGAAGLDVALKQYAGLQAGVKPSAAAVVKVKQLLGSLAWSKGTELAPCVIAAWLGGAPDGALLNWAGPGTPFDKAAIEKKGGTTTQVCGLPKDWKGDVDSVDYYLQLLGQVAPNAAGLLKSAGTASVSAAKASEDKQVKQDVAKAVDKAKEVASDVASAAVNAVSFAGFGAGAILVIAVIVAAIIYLPKRA